MSLIGRILGEERTDVVGGISPRDPAYWLQKLMGGGPTKSGVPMDEQKALTLSAFWDGVNIISGAVGMLPFFVFQRDGDSRHRAPAHPVNRIIHERANPYMDALTFRQTLQGHLLGWGNAYAEIERDGAGRPLNLWPLPPNIVTPTVEGPDDKPEQRRLVYKVILGGKPKTVLYENMFHLKGLSPDGLKGYSVVQVARESLGMAKATEDYGAVFFKNNATPPAVLEHPAKLSDTSEAHLRKSWEDTHKGVENQHKIAILEEGMKLHVLGLPPQDAQFLDSRQFSVVEVARWLNIPPHMLKSLERSTFNNIEQQAIEFIVWTLMPWLTRWQNETNVKLFGAVGRRKFFSEFVTAALLRGDIKSRYDAYRVAINSGWLNRNTVRGFENLNRVDGLDGYWQPVNVVSVGEDGQAQIPTSTVVTMVEAASSGRLALPPQTSETRSFDDEAEADAKYRALFESTWRRIVTKEVNAVKRCIKKADQYDEEARQHVEEFYSRHETHVIEVLEPVMKIFSVGRDIVERIARQYIQDSRADMIASLENGKPLELLDEWTNGKAARMAEEMIARREA
jgi:HK97 family phage portal protein